MGSSEAGGVRQIGQIAAVRLQAGVREVHDSGLTSGAELGRVRDDVVRDVDGNNPDAVRAEANFDSESRCVGSRMVGRPE